MTETTSPRLILAWRPVDKNWIAWPSIKRTNQDGAPKLGPDGKQLWSPIIEFANKATLDKCGE